MASDSVKKDLDALKKYQSATKDISAMLVRSNFLSQVCRGDLRDLSKFKNSPTDARQAARGEF